MGWLPSTTIAASARAATPAARAAPSDNRATSKRVAAARWRVATSVPSTAVRHQRPVAMLRSTTVPSWSSTNENVSCTVQPLGPR
jgi:hypothetical protein